MKKGRGSGAGKRTSYAKEAKQLKRLGAMTLGVAALHPLGKAAKSVGAARKAVKAYKHTRAVQASREAYNTKKATKILNNMHRHKAKKAATSPSLGTPKKPSSPKKMGRRGKRSSY